MTHAARHTRYTMSRISWRISVLVKSFVCLYRCFLLSLCHRLRRFCDGGRQKATCVYQVLFSFGKYFESDMFFILNLCCKVRQSASIFKLIAKRFHDAVRRKTIKSVGLRPVDCAPRQHCCPHSSEHAAFLQKTSKLTLPYLTQL